MTAIVNISGTQVKMVPDTLVKIPKINNKVGTTVEYDKVLFVEDGDTISVGKPYVASAKVATVVFAHDRTKKTRASIYKRRKQYRKTWGFRAEFTLLKVVKVNYKK